MAMTAKQWVEYRDDVLLSGDVARVQAMLRELGHDATYASAEVAMHEAITAAHSLPMEYRSKSKKWLAERGFRALDDGDVP